MKKFVLTIKIAIVLLVTTTSFSQIINFPDANFKAVLLNNPTIIDTNDNGEIEVSEAQNVYDLTVFNVPVSNLSGLEYFINLEILDVVDTMVSSLDVSFFPNLTSLNCRNNLINNLTFGTNPNLYYIECQSNQITSLNLDSLISLTYLYCGQNLITNISLNQCVNLGSFDCSYNLLTQLDLSNLLSLVQIDCSYNSLQSIVINNPIPLFQLFCSHNQLTSLNVNVLVDLFQLECNNNNLQTLSITNLPNFGYLKCENNLLTNLSITNCTSFVSVKCQNNQLASLNFNDLPVFSDLNCEDNLLTNLSITNCDLFGSLRCRNNHLTNLNFNNLPNFMELKCENNFLTSLSVTNCPNFFYLDCQNNQLTNFNFNDFPNLISFNGNNNLFTSINLNGLNNLNGFQCTDNLLTQVDLTLNSCSYCNFNFNNNHLTSILGKNGVQQYVSFVNNPDLTLICCDDFEVTLYQGYITSNGLVNCIATSYCGPNFVEPTIQGVFTYDNTLNGCNISDPIITDVKLKVYRSSIIQPFYAFNSSPLILGQFYNTYFTSIPTFENTGYFTVTPPEIGINLYQAPITNIIQDFCVAPNGTHNDLEVILLPISDAIPGNNITYKLVYKNKGTHTQSGNLSLNVPSNLTFISSSINPSSQSINQIQWSFTDLLPFETREISLTLNLDAAVGTVLNFSTSVSSSNVDQTPADNIFQLNQTAIASPTANTITCLQGASIQTSQVGNYVHYLIRFKNNSLQDVNSISITTDMLNIDHNTIIPISASHQYTASIKEMLTNNIFEVKFQFIALQVNEEGYIAFKIKTFPNLVTGNNFKNTAKIFFNNNAPIVTNTATTYVGNILSTDNFEKNDTLVFYPNPAQNKVAFNQEVKTVLVYTLDGKLLNTQLINNQIDLSGFNPGIYLVSGTTNNGVSFSEKLVKN